MKKHSITFILAVLVSFVIKAQSGENVQGFKSIPQEHVYVHFSESLLFSGEHLLYKVYCMDNAERKLSSLSKMAYIALVGEDGNTVFKHKIRLNSGSGSGDFFVPTSIPTGSYKLLGYSEWMQNFGQKDFFQSDIYIVNPYQTTSGIHLEQPVDTLIDSIAPPLKPLVLPEVPSKQSVFANMAVDRSTVGKREKVTLKVTGTNGAVNNGSYSISVRKVDSLPAPSQMTSDAFVSSFLRLGQNNVGASKIDLPELRGEVISGTVLDKESQEPVENLRISLSLPGDKYLFNVATSNNEGKFRFIVNREYDNTKAALQVLSTDWDRYQISIDEYSKEYENLEFSGFTLSKNMKDYILRKSIHNQIENVYREARSDSMVPAQHVTPFYRQFTEVYNLDDYTRFNGIPETIVEVVDQVSIRKLNDGERVFEVRPGEGFTDNSLLPIVFVDGLFIRRHEDIMGYSAKKIQSIKFSRDKVLVGSQMFQGVVSLETIEGDFYSDFYTPHIVNLDLFKPQSRKDYHIQQYDENGNHERIPDFRHQLFWEPNLDLSTGSNEIIFYTSDVPGVYELVLEGFTSNGNPVSVKEKLVVE